MIFKLDMNSSTPIYLKIRNEIVIGVGRGELKTRYKSVRVLRLVIFKADKKASTRCRSFCYYFRFFLRTTINPTIAQTSTLTNIAIVKSFSCPTCIFSSSSRACSNSSCNSC